MQSYHIKNVQLVNRGKTIVTDLLIKNNRIERIDPNFDVAYKTTEINGENLFIAPGIIDDQVHFREPGLTHKADIHSESRAAVAGGITSFMEMPNTNPATLTTALLDAKYKIGENNSIANFSFFMGVSNDNFDEVMQVSRLHQKDVCGLKIFMGSSTGNMLVDRQETLERVFAESNMLIATHCEDEATIRENNHYYTEKYGDKLTASFHPIIRNEAACYRSSSMAVALAKKHNTRLHILHISTAEETELFDNSIPLSQKRITAEACVHHLFFDAADYATHGNNIKCNPAIKDKRHKDMILQAVLENKIDIIATDHAPHTADEKNQHYSKAPSGLPLVQHSFQIMMDLHKEGKISLEKIIEKMCHAPADCFLIKERGYADEGYWADLMLFDIHQPHTVSQANILYKCGWSPFEKHTFGTSILKTFVNGNLVFDNGKIIEGTNGKRLLFDR